MTLAPSSHRTAERLRPPRVPAVGLIDALLALPPRDIARDAVPMAAGVAWRPMARRLAHRGLEGALARQTTWRSTPANGGIGVTEHG